MQEAVSGLNEYPDGGCTQLKAALAAHWQVQPEQLTVASGSNSLLMDLATACLKPGTQVVYCWPSFVVYRMSAQLTGATFRELPLAADGNFDLEAILATINSATRIVYLCTPNNPTGAVLSKAAFADFMARVPEHVLVVVDQAYQEFVTTEDAADPFEYFDGKRPLVILRTFSKMYAMAGARVGYGIAPAPVVEAIDKIRTPFNVNSVAQAGAIAALADQDELLRRKMENARNRSALCECFQRLGLKYYPSQANFVWVYVPQAAVVFDKLLHEGIIVRNFSADGGLRISVGDTSGTKATISAFERILQG
jgi:histidinol-phosphate aminotransferase